MARKLKHHNAHCAVLVVVSLVRKTTETHVCHSLCLVHTHLHANTMDQTPQSRSRILRRRLSIQWRHPTHCHWRSNHNTMPVIVQAASSCKFEVSPELLPSQSNAFPRQFHENGLCKCRRRCETNKSYPSASHDEQSALCSSGSRRS